MLSLKEFSFVGYLLSYPLASFVDYTTETSFTRLSCSGVAALGFGGQGVFLPRHMDGGLVYKLTTISL
jgi:hypothetical protein